MEFFTDDLKMLDVSMDQPGFAWICLGRDTWQAQQCWTMEITEVIAVRRGKK
jgi:hypothetical protein